MTIKSNKVKKITTKTNSENLTFYSVFKVFPEPILVTSEKGVICFVNGAWEKLTGYKLEEVKGKKPSIVVGSGKTAEKIHKRIWERLSKGKPFITDDIIDKKKDGTEYVTHSVFFRFQDHNTSVFYVQSIHDITENLSIRKQLQESENRLRTIIDNAKGYAIYMLDKNGNIKSWNKGAEQMSGYKHEEVRGKHISLFYKKKDIKDERPERGLRKAIKYGKFEDEMERVRKDGTHYYARISISSIKNEKKELQGYVQITHDISLQKKLEKQRDEFITMASHVLKTPITSMKMYSEILERKISSEGEKNLELISHMRKQTNDLISLIDDLLHADSIMKKNWEINKKSVDLNMLFSNFISDMQILSKSHKLILSGKVKENVLIDKDSIIEVMRNLITNAIEYSPNKSKVLISVFSNQKTATVTVQDFGFGIAEEDKRDLFQKFYQSKTKQKWHIGGMGLGLYIASEIIKLHQGKMWVESVEGEGSTFSFSLPLDKNKHQS